MKNRIKELEAKAKEMEKNKNRTSDENMELVDIYNELSELYMEQGDKNIRVAMVAISISGAAILISLIIHIIKWLS